MTTKYDVIVAGGGVVGCAAALALTQKLSLKVAVIESHPPRQSDIHPSFDARVIALAGASLKHLEAWGFKTTTVPGADIRRIHVSDRKHVGQTVLDAKDLEVSTFGKVVRLEDLGLQLYDALKDIAEHLPNASAQDSAKTSMNKVDYYAPESIEAVERDNGSVLVTTQKRRLNAKLLVIAEGANSLTRDMLGMYMRSEDYEQSAVISNVVMELPHKNCAYERFTKYGPIAFLPMEEPQKENNNNDSPFGSSALMSVVWTCSSERVDDIVAMSDDTFGDELNALFGTKLGRVLRVGPRHAYPLALKQCDDFAIHRCICIGNAAQSLHPIAGQGFNLGVRDISDLLKALADEDDAGKYAVIDRYRNLRKQDKHTVINATDMLVKGFSNHYLPFVIGRNKALSLLNLMPPLKNKFARLAMGRREA